MQKNRLIGGGFENNVGLDDDSSSSTDTDTDTDTNDDELRDIVLVAQNGNRFDIPFLFKSFETYGVDIADIPFKGKIDTIELVKKAIAGNAAIRVPENYRLGTLYKLATGLDLEEAHRAINDTKATLSIFQSECFWSESLK